ncbi:MAG: hypothetical protein GPOALKHO_000955 [Sodalis sp.]|nr:MAG: hypothetical protein GPOALKHO_000955 [Sodalis sp.]
MTSRKRSNSLLPQTPDSRKAERPTTNIQAHPKTLRQQRADWGQAGKTTGGRVKDGAGGVRRRITIRRAPGQRVAEPAPDAAPGAGSAEEDEDTVLIPAP